MVLSTVTYQFDPSCPLPTPHHATALTNTAIACCARRRRIQHVSESLECSDSRRRHLPMGTSSRPKTAVQLELPASEQWAAQQPPPPPPDSSGQQAAANAAVQQQAAWPLQWSIAAHRSNTQWGVPVDRLDGGPGSSKQPPAPPQSSSKQPPAPQSSSGETSRSSFVCCVKALLWDVLLPMSPVMLAWDLVMLLLVGVYIAFALPFGVSFGMSNASNAWARIDLAVAVLFLIDVWMHFRVCVIDDDGRLVTQRRRIAATYVLRGWFCFDLLTSIPWEQLLAAASAAAQGWSALAAMLKVTRIAGLIKLISLFKLLRLVRLVRLPSIVARLEALFGRAHLRFAMLAGSMLLLLHWTACLWYGVARLENDADSWIAHAGLEDSSTGELYVTALYWSVTTMATVGYGDITGRTVREKLVAMLAMLVGVSLFAFFMGSVSAFITTIHKSSARVAAKRQAVDEFLRHRRVPRSLADKIRDFYAYVAERELHAEEEALIAGLSASLRTQLVLHLYQEALEKVNFFRGRHPSFITHVVTCLRLQYYAPGDVVVRQGDFGGELHFVAAGTLEARLHEDESGVPLATATFKRSLAHKHSRASGLGKPLASPRATGDTQHEAAAAPGGCMPGLMAGARRALCACGSDSQSADAGAATAADECCSCGGKASPPGDVPCHHLSLHARRTSGRKKVAYIDELGETPFRLLRSIHAGEYFGEAACLTGVPHAATVVATTHCELYCLNRADLEGVLQHFPELCIEFDEMMVQQAGSASSSTPPLSTCPSSASSCLGAGSPLGRWSAVKAVAQQRSAVQHMLGSAKQQQQQQDPAAAGPVQAGGAGATDADGMQQQTGAAAVMTRPC